MLSSQWVCQRCGRVGGFRLLGSGFIVCSGCGQVHVVPGSGRIYPVGKREPMLVGFLPRIGGRYS